MPSRTGFYWDSRFAWIDVGNGPFGPSNTSAFLPPNPGTADPVSEAKRKSAAIGRVTAELVARDTSLIISSEPVHQAPSVRVD